MPGSAGASLPEPEHLPLGVQHSLQLPGLPRWYESAAEVGLHRSPREASTSTADPSAVHLADCGVHVADCSARAARADAAAAAGVQHGTAAATQAQQAYGHGAQSRAVAQGRVAQGRGVPGHVVQQQHGHPHSCAADEFGCYTLLSGAGAAGEEDPYVSARHGEVDWRRAVGVLEQVTRQLEARRRRARAEAGAATAAAGLHTGAAAARSPPELLKRWRADMDRVDEWRLAPAACVSVLPASADKCRPAPSACASALRAGALPPSLSVFCC